MQKEDGAKDFLPDDKVSDYPAVPVIYSAIALYIWILRG